MFKDDAFDPEHLNIAFHRLQPEVLLSSIRAWYDFSPRPSPLRVSAGSWGSFAYQHYTTAYSGTYRTDDEAHYLDRHFKQRMASEDGSQSVFELLRRYSETLLTIDGDQPLCRYERVLRWRKISLTLSHDLFTTAYLASKDLKPKKTRKNFVWPAIIGTDNERLTQIAAQGLAENHFHLNGSTRLFTLSWMCMMNHPEQIHVFFSQEKTERLFQDRLNQALTMGPNIIPLSWEELLLYAAYLRARLFVRAIVVPQENPAPQSLDGWIQSFLDFDDQPAERLRMTQELVETLRYDPAAVRLPQKSHRPMVLDYAMTDDLIGCLDSNNRLLAGERHLLYSLFLLCFSGELTPQEQNCFYLYLLIQNQFRSELIQVNERVGFQNFNRYQERKDIFWEDLHEYKDEAIRLGVNAVLETGYIRSLEARINPGKNQAQQYTKVLQDDEAYCFALTGKMPRQEHLDMIADSPLFYVFHFPKNTKEIPDSFTGTSKDICSLFYPRNSTVRATTERQARQIAKALASSPYLRKRVRAIDACANEIGCRPETFATDFRFLRSGIPCERGNYFVPDTDSTVYLRATYHAGEDFIDLIDGLRAIDEAQHFLELRQGDRLGHALALGVDPENYYRFKHMRLIIPKQELLDNLIWILYRPGELQLALPGSLQEKLEDRVMELMNEIGYDTTQFTPQEYYLAWQLRGDHPSEYLREWSEDPFCIQEYDYKNFYRMKEPALTAHRQNPKIRHLLNLYHFDTDIKKKGAVVESYIVEPDMIALVEQLQNRMQHQLKDRGIAIECNPSSNVLIGPFDKYRDHPIFRFNRQGLRVPRWEKETSADLCVSVNTDDQGVFDTSLESEYAYVALSLERELDENGNRLNSDEEIYAYLDHLRILGNSQTFHHMGEDIFARDYADFRKELIRASETPFD